jgi:hypothetical protein
VVDIILIIETHIAPHTGAPAMASARNAEDDPHDQYQAGDAAAQAMLELVRLTLTRFPANGRFRRSRYLRCAAQ